MPSEAAPSSAPSSGPPAQTWLTGRRLALGVTALGVLGLIGVGWMVRIPVAEWAIGQALDARGVAHSFKITRLDFTGAALTDVRLGDAAAPDARAAAVEARIAWAPAPRIEEVSVTGLRVTARLDDQGIRFGALDALLQPSQPAAEPALPDLRLAIADARLDLISPMGPITAVANGGGRLKRDFALAGEVRGPNGLAGDFTAASGETALNAKLNAKADAVDFAGVTASAVAVDATVVAGPNGEQQRFQFDASAKTAAVGEVRVTAPRAAGAGGADGDWSVSASRAEFGPAAIEAMRLQGRWLAPHEAGFRVTARFDGSDSAANTLRLTAPGRTALASLAAPADTPFHAPLAQLRKALSAAGQGATLAGEATYDASGQGRLQIGQVTATSTGGARAALTPGASGFALSGPTLRPQGDLNVRLAGGGLPTFTANLAADGERVRAALDMAPLRVGDAILAADVPTLEIDLSQSRYRMSGALTASGPLAGGRIEDLTAPLTLTGDFGGGFAIAPADRCLTIRARRLIAAGGLFDNPSAALCATDRDFLRVSGNGGLSGGVRAARTTLTGKLADTGQPAALSMTAATIRFRGRGGEAELQAPQFTADLKGGGLRAGAERVAVAFGPQGLSGSVRGGGVDGDALPVTIAQAQVAFRADGDGVALSEGRALVNDRRPTGADGEGWRRRFNTLALDTVTGRLDEGLLTTQGAVVLVGEVGAGGRPRAPRQLGRFTARHDLPANRGEASVISDPLVFDETFDAFDISEPIRGVATDVAGKLQANLAVAWEQGALAAQGELAMDAISFNTAALGRVETVTGEVRFEDLLALRSAPGQVFTVGRIDPGVGVVNGRLQFQVLSPNAVRLESARWPLGAGTLSIAPQDLDLSIRRFEITLELAAVDLQDLIDTLGLSDIKATGEIAGRFPLKFDENGARIEGGRLASVPGGGALSYTGPVGQALNGPPRLAFDALQGFAYTNLVMTLDGSLAGNLRGRIAFDGVNTAPLTDLASLAPMAVDVGEGLGLPFRFNVAVEAPFREMLSGYQCVVDTWGLTQQAIDLMRNQAPEGHACRATANVDRDVMRQPR